MKKTIIGVTVLAALVIVVFVLLYTLKTHNPELTDTSIEGRAEDSIEPEQEIVVFDMTYRGLGAPKDEPRCYSSYSYSRSREMDTSFIKDVKAKAENLQIVYNRDFRGAKWSAIQLEGRNPVAFFFDLNADGKMSEDEKILPLPESKWTSKQYPEFITPDFMMNTSDGRQVPFRVLLRVDRSGRSSGRPSRPSCSWTPHCVLEGTSIIDGETATLILFADGTSGSFTKFGGCSYSLRIGEKGDEKTERFKPNPLLSKIIHHNDAFYHLNLIDNHEKDQFVRAELKKYTGAISEVVFKATGNKPLEINLDFPWGIECKDKDLYFRVSGNRFKLPAGSYVFTKGYVHYGVEDEDQCRVSIEDLKMKVGSRKVETIELGKPVLSVTAVDVNKQNKEDAKNQSVFSKGTKIRFTRIIRGASGGRYDRFFQRHLSTHGDKRVDPTIRIVDSDGGEIIPGKVEYG